MDPPAKARKRKSSDIRGDQRGKGAIPVRNHSPEDRSAALVAANRETAAWRSPNNKSIATPGSFAEVSEAVSKISLVDISQFLLHKS
jgi:hypothetical protein